MKKFLQISEEHQGVQMQDEKKANIHNAQNK
jgi:hypothetical protein